MKRIMDEQPNNNGLLSGIAEKLRFNWKLKVVISIDMQESPNKPTAAARQHEELQRHPLFRRPNDAVDLTVRDSGAQ